MAGDLKRQPRLPDATGAGEGHQPVVGEEPPNGVYFGVAPDETGELRREMLRARAFRCAKRWEVIAKVGVAQLRNPFGSGKVPQGMGAEVQQPRVGGQPVGKQIACRGRQDRLTPVTQVAQPRRAVDGRPDVVCLVAQLHLAGM
ncbi:hypothetical protein, partial [Mycobacterium sp. E1386]|uniref:hypothetical protein n=1 Tax=Mycobacterium sp. E1386 TaxID=1834126 RepID=UPI001E5C7A36